jgi:diguanylate cyclase (GGDEF)-like protein
VEGSLLDRVHAEDAGRVAGFLSAVAAKPPGESAEAEWRMVGADGTRRHVSAVATNLIDDPHVGGLVLTVRDDDARKRFEDQLRHRAFHDELTGLANRALFYDRTDHALSRGTREGRDVAVLFVDLDDFKPVNDRLGHAAGDQLLQLVAKRLMGCVRSADTVARLGGDEFGILLEDTGTERAVQAAERVLAALETRFDLPSEALRVSASVGVAVSRDGVRDVEELLRAADRAMYEAKRAGKHRFAVHDPSAHTADADGALRLFMSSEAQRAEIVSVLEDPDALTMVFQPVLDLRTGRVAAYEALARFNRTPARTPDKWFAQAQRLGLGAALEARALAAALAVRGRPAGTRLTLNLSLSSLGAPEIEAVLPERLDDFVIEVTENELAIGDPATAAAIASLRARGAALAVDDTGAGYAGLTHVMRLAPDVIKLDRALTTGIDSDPVKAALVSSFVRYARDIDATVCAEGIETAEELARLADLDVAFGQGFLIGRPSAPWIAASPEPAAACQASFQAAFASKGSGSDDDQRLDTLLRTLAAAGSAQELELRLRPMADLLGADDVRVVGHPAPAGLVLASDPDAEPAAAAELRAAGYGARLVLPIGAHAHLVAYSRRERPWTRFHLGRGRIVTHQLDAVLERKA